MYRNICVTQPEHKVVFNTFLTLLISSWVAYITTLPPTRHPFTPDIPSYRAHKINCLPLFVRLEGFLIRSQGFLFEL
jgi:hypothetical protein